MHTKMSMLLFPYWVSVRLAVEWRVLVAFAVSGAVLVLAPFHVWRVVFGGTGLGELVLEVLLLFLGWCGFAAVQPEIEGILELFEDGIGFAFVDVDESGAEGPLIVLFDPSVSGVEGAEAGDEIIVAWGEEGVLEECLCFGVIGDDMGASFVVDCGAAETAPLVCGDE
jgi:hypothetical protein